MKKSLTICILLISSIAHAGIFVPEALKLPCYNAAILSAQKQTLKLGKPVSETSITSARKQDGVSSFVVVVRAEFEEQMNSEENDIYFAVDVLRRGNKCEVLSVKNVAL
jgi:hypothetical protein